MSNIFSTPSPDLHASGEEVAPHQALSQLTSLAAQKFAVEFRQLEGMLLDNPRIKSGHLPEALEISLVAITTQITVSNVAAALPWAQFAERISALITDINHPVLYAAAQESANRGGIERGIENARRLLSESRLLEGDDALTCEVIHCLQAIQGNLFPESFRRHYLPQGFRLVRSEADL